MKHSQLELRKKFTTNFPKLRKEAARWRAIEDGYYASRISERAIRRQRELDKGERVAIGVNKYRSDSKVASGGFKIDPSAERQQVEQLERVKKERNNQMVKDTLEYVRKVAEGDGNLVPPVLEAVRAYATIGEICGVLRDVFGEYQAREYFK